MNTKRFYESPRAEVLALEVKDTFLEISGRSFSLSDYEEEEA